MTHGSRCLRMLMGTLAVLLSLVATANADFTEWDWYLGASVRDFSESPSLYDGAHFLSVDSPFLTSHSGTIGNSFASSSYDFTGTGDTASFLIQAEHRAEYAAGEVISTSQGAVRFTPNVDLLVRVDGAYTYELPAYDMSADFYVGFGTRDPEWEIVFEDGGGAFTSLYAPLAGTFNIEGEGILPANTPCFLQYFMTLNTSSSLGATVTGSGYLNIEMEPVPEPSTFGLLAMSGFLVFRRKRA